MKLEVYLYFPGNCCEAMEFYKNIFGGELETTTYAESGIDDPAKKDKLMHTTLKGGEISLMASDTDGASDAMSKAELALVGRDEEKMRKVFDGLCKGARSSRDLQKEMWGDIYGKVTDKFGVDWAMNIGPVTSQVQ